MPRLESVSHCTSPLCEGSPVRDILESSNPRCEGVAAPQWLPGPTFYLHREREGGGEQLNRPGRIKLWNQMEPNLTKLEETDDF